MPLTITDVPPDGDPIIDHTNATYEYACEECGTELFYAGKGRKPVRCTPKNGGDPECHKTAVATPRVLSGKGKSNVDSLVISIAGTHRQVGMLLGFYPPASADGMVIASEAANLAEAWRPLLERDKALRDWWEKFFKVSGYGGLFMAYGMVAMSIAQNHNLLPKPAAAMYVQPPQADAGVQPFSFGTQTGYEEGGAV